MPVVLRIEGFAFSFFSSDAKERKHVHVRKAEGKAKFWLDPIELATSQGFSPHELRLISRIIMKHDKRLREAWNEYFGII